VDGIQKSGVVPELDGIVRPIIGEQRSSIIAADDEENYAILVTTKYCRYKILLI